MSHAGKRHSKLSLAAGGYQPPPGPDNNYLLFTSLWDIELLPEMASCYALGGGSEREGVGWGSWGWGGVGSWGGGRRRKEGVKA